MNALTEKLDSSSCFNRQSCGVLISFIIHVLILYAFGITLVEKAQYGISSGAGVAAATEETQTTEVSLIEFIPEVPQESEFLISSQEAPVKPIVKKEQIKKKADSYSGTRQDGSNPGLAYDLGAAYLNNPPPAYPAESRRLKEEGVVMLRVDISSQGKVEQLALNKSSGYERLDQAALKAVRKWIFQPSVIAGIRISETVIVPISFRLKN